MATFAISISFTAGAKDHDKAYELAERIGAYVQQEDMASEYAVVDVELLEDDQPDEDGELDEDYE